MGKLFRDWDACSDCWKAAKKKAEEAELAAKKKAEEEAEARRKQEEEQAKVRQKERLTKLSLRFDRACEMKNASDGRENRNRHQESYARWQRERAEEDVARGCGVARSQFRGGATTQ